MWHTNCLQHTQPLGLRTLTITANTESTWINTMTNIHKNTQFWHSACKCLVTVFGFFFPCQIYNSFFKSIFMGNVQKNTVIFSFQISYCKSVLHIWRIFIPSPFRNIHLSLSQTLWWWFFLCLSSWFQMSSFCFLKYHNFAIQKKCISLSLLTHLQILPQRTQIATRHKEREGSDDRPYSFWYSV